MGASWQRLWRAVGDAVSGQTVLAVGAALMLILTVSALLPDRFGSAAGGSLGQPVMVNAALPGLTPFAPTTPMRFGGRVTEVATIGSEMGWGQMHIWIDDGTGAVREVSVAPQTYLTQIGCGLGSGMRVSGTGFQFDVSRPNAELYAKTIVVGGQMCKVRDDEGLALWLNPDR